TEEGETRKAHDVELLAGFVGAKDARTLVVRAALCHAPHVGAEHYGRAGGPGVGCPSSKLLSCRPGTTPSPPAFRSLDMEDRPLLPKDLPSDCAIVELSYRIKKPEN